MYKFLYVLRTQFCVIKFSLNDTCYYEYYFFRKHQVAIWTTKYLVSGVKGPLALG